MIQNGTDDGESVRRAGSPEDFATSPDTLRTLADDHRLCEMPAKFRWSMQWAAAEIARLRRGEFAVWKNADKSVSKLLYRNADGKLFDLMFVPMEEPCH